MNTRFILKMASIKRLVSAEMEDFAAVEMNGVKLASDYDVAIFTGGEERLEKLTGFRLVKNTLFDDGVHKYMISLEDYVAGVEKLFYKISMNELYSMMPDNPKWMDGARSGRGAAAAYL